ncbi:YTH domain [Brachionus plicatilis]|uniref:YTH domain n=1 Tax=Brachionus plicatilis TaxID=10195 RepID=A0A3M7QHZ8_BRAPC|nr:YTH domain [Brachionus plicatilis]
MNNNEKLMSDQSNKEEISNAELPKLSQTETVETHPINYMQSPMCYLVPPYRFVPPQYNNQFYMYYRNGNNFWNNQNLVYNENNYPVNDIQYFQADQFGNRSNRKNFKQSKKTFQNRKFTLNPENTNASNQFNNLPMPAQFENNQTLQKDNQNFNNFLPNYQYHLSYQQNPIYNQFVPAQLASNFNNLNISQNYFYNNLNDNANSYSWNQNDFKFNGEIEGAKESRFFVIKSYSVDHVKHSVKNGIWCSTVNGNQKLNQAFSECSETKYGSVYLFFSVNGSGLFCGMAEMTTEVDFETKLDLWAQDKWKGKFCLNWIFVKDIPNRELKHIFLPNNENKPVTKSRDTQEILFDQAFEMVNIFRTYPSGSSLIYLNDLNNSIENNANEHVNQTTPASHRKPSEKNS